VTVVAALAAAIAFGVWRLARGPIDLGWLTPRLEAALGAPDGSLRVRIGTTRLEWDPRDRDVDVRLLDVRAYGSDGALLAEVPALAVRPSLPALLRGVVAPASIELLGARLRVARGPEPGVDVDIGAGAHAGGDAVGQRLVDGIMGRVPAGSAVAWLRKIAVRDASVAVVDETGAGVAALEGLDFRLARRAGDGNDGPAGVELTLAADLVVGGRRIPLRAAGHHRVDDTTEARVEYAGLEPRALAPLAARANPALGAALARVGVALTGSATLALDAALVLRQARLEAESGPGAVALADPGSGDTPIHGLRVVMSADRATDRLTVETLTADLGGPDLAVHGEVTGLDPPRAIALDATLTELPTDALGRWWPAGAAAEARAWVTERVRGGQVRRATAELGLTRGADGLAVERLAGTVLFDGLAVAWLDGMPPLTAAAGRGTFDRAAWRFQVARGTVAGVGIVDADVTIDGLAADAGRAAPAPRLSVVARVNGPLRAALAVLDHEPFGAARAIGVAPADASGTLDGRATVAFPLAKPALDLRATARLRNVRLARIGGGWPLDGGSFDLTFAGRRLDATGTARVAGAPLTLAWHEDLTAGSRRATARGRVGAAERAALGFDLRPTLDGPVDVDASLAGAAGGRATLTLAIDLAPAVLDLPAVAIAKPAGEPGRVSGRFTLDGAALVAADDVRLDSGRTSLRASATRTADRKRWRTIDVDATLRPPAPGGPTGHVTLDVRPAPGQAAGNRLSLRSDDAGAMLRAIDPAMEVRGGRLVYTATGDLAAPGMPIDGRLDVQAFTITKSPLMARLATLGSFGGIRDALAGRGVVFDELGARVAHQGHTITISEGRATGPAVALTAAGTIDRTAGTIALRGTVVPSYLGINTAVGRLPVVGRLIAGTDREGIQAFDFHVRGPLSKPEVRVDKLASIAPGALRDLFRRLPR
jgi:hypothetical protein